MTSVENAAKTWCLLELNMQDDLLLNVQNLSVELDHKSIIKNLSFILKKGDVVSVLGPNGAGKTVLLKCLLGLLPYTGKITWKNNIKIGYVPQRLPFIKDIPLGVSDFFALKRISNQDMRQIMHAVGLNEDFISRKIGELSSGQFQRILIAWSLVGKPQVLMFDEPTTGIDIGGEETIYKLLTRLKEQWYDSMILVTHDLNVVYEFSTHVICLNKQTVCSGSPHEVLTPESLRSLYGSQVKYYQHHE